jgi:hypothetical protein
MGRVTYDELDKLVDDQVIVVELTVLPLEFTSDTTTLLRYANALADPLAEGAAPCCVLN